MWNKLHFYIGNHEFCYMCWINWCKVSSCDTRHYECRCPVCREVSSIDSNLSSNIVEILGLNICQQINFTEIVRLNLNDILSLPTKSIIEPIYISDNKLFN